jgi:hypothetical protein
MSNPTFRYFFLVDFFAAVFFAEALVAVAAFFAGAFLTAVLVATFFVVAFAAVTLPPVADVFCASEPDVFFGFPPPNAFSQPVAYCEFEPTRVIVMSFPFEY